MKKLSLLIVTVFATFTMNATNTPDSYTNQVRTQIAKLLEKSPIEVNQEIKAQIEFLITKNGEILITKVDSKNNLIEDYLKKQLNYKKVNVETKNRMRFFKMPLRVIKNS